MKGLLACKSLTFRLVAWLTHAKSRWFGAFFLRLNAAVALYTCFLPVKIWTLYNGLISYLLAGGLFAGEWIVRQFVRKEH
ncbi:hypothetical protein VDIAB_270376 [Vibrio diabolicus]|nr:hypothetical protein VDIAB_270376 [Vibrio diabolicus]